MLQGIGFAMVLLFCRGAGSDGPSGAETRVNSVMPVAIGAEGPAEIWTEETDPIQQYAFLIGDWSVAVTLRQPDGSEFTYAAKWHNSWLAKGQVVLQEWDGPYAQGLELRHYSATAGHWIGRNLYLPNPGTWYDNVAEWVNGEMVVTTVRETPDGQKSISREIYGDIMPDGFSIRTEASLDGGKTWQPGRYSAKMTRI